MKATPKCMMAAVLIGAIQSLDAASIATTADFEDLEEGTSLTNGIADSPTGSISHWYLPDASYQVTSITTYDTTTTFSNACGQPGGLSGQGSHYLSLKTAFGKPLWRTVNPLVDGKAEPHTVGDCLTFDFMAKLTTCDESPSWDNLSQAPKTLLTGSVLTGSGILKVGRQGCVCQLDDKLAVYFLEDEEEVNVSLCVSAGTKNATSGQIEEKCFQYTPEEMNAETWNRFSIKVVTQDGFLRFYVYFNGILLSEDPFYARPATETDLSVTALGFDGQGSIDNVVINEVDPIFPWSEQALPDGGPYTENVDGIEWTFFISNRTARVEGRTPGSIANGTAVSTSISGSLTIPDTLGDCPVTCIGNYAFYYCSGLTSVTIPSSVTSICERAFYNCSRLTSVTIPSSVTSIGSYAFSGCGLASVTVPGRKCGIDFSAVTNLVISEGTTSIGYYAFSGCSGLTSVTISEGVANIGSSAFSGCSGLTSVTISEGVANIGTAAFRGCSKLTSVTIPSTVTNIGSYAFCGCSGLTSVTISEGVTSIGSYAFSGCSGLTNVTIPSSVTSIGSCAFSSCGALCEFVVEEGNPTFKSVNGLLLTKDGKTLVSGVNGNVTIPSSVTNIGSYAFESCSGLTSVTIPEGVTNIGSYAFRNCSGLTSVTFKGNAPVNGSGVFTDTPANLKIYVGTDSEGWMQWNGKALKFVDMGGEQSGGSASTSTQSATLTVTNVVIHYVVNSIMPERASPLSPDTGFVNVITEVKSGGAVSVPESWTANYTDYAARFGADFVKSLMKPTGKRDGAGNAMLVWQDYVAGTDPTDEEDVFKASVTIIDGKVTVSYTPELSEAETAKRIYKTLGKVHLTDENWVEVPAGSEGDYNFFKVTVEMK